MASMCYHCDACNLTVNSEEQLNQHYSGSKHKARVSGSGPGPGFNQQQQRRQNRTEEFKSSGLDYFVKAENARSNDDTQEIKANSALNNQSQLQQSQNTRAYCSTCRIAMTSETQAETHYNGAKHRGRAKLLEEQMKFQGDGGAAFQNNLADFNNPDTFCQTCRIKLTSSSQAQMHYVGQKHRQKEKCLREELRASAEAALEQSVMPAKETPNSDAFCSTCRLTLTSPSQAEMHYSGAKHKSKLKLLERTRQLTQQSHYQMEGEPSAKRGKYMEICEVCNVELTCGNMAKDHYTGAKHQKRLVLLKQLEEGNLQTPHQPQNPHQKAQVENFSGGRVAINDQVVPRGGHLYCSFCDVRMNSQTQMDAHRSGGKHKLRVEQMAGSRQSVTIVQNVQTKTTSYTRTAQQMSFSNSNNAPAGSCPTAYPQSRWTNLDSAPPVNDPNPGSYPNSQWNQINNAPPANPVY